VVGIFSIPTCARKSANAESNIDRIEELAASATVLGTDLDTARGYGEIKTALQLKGRPIPENDLWIAAICLQHDLILATRDDHFKEVAALVTEAW
jgi:tRNA(fMet)-specific endonuclease VapC